LHAVLRGAHAPLWQLPLQQSADAEHAWLSAMQACVLH
jgi:hypothetical protein